MSNEHRRQAGLEYSRLQIGERSGGSRFALFAGLLTTGTSARAATAPYPPSPLIEGITRHTKTHRTDAGASFDSDFPGENGPDRVSLGLARIEGFPPNNWLGLKGRGKAREMLFISIPAQWISLVSRTLWFIYTGGLDSFNLAKGTLELSENALSQTNVVSRPVMHVTVANH